MITLLTPSLVTGVQQAALTATTTAATTTSASAIFKGIFSKLFHNPSFLSVAIVAGLFIGFCVGLAWLIKKIYNRCCPEKLLRVDLNHPPDTATLDPPRTLKV